METVKTKFCQHVCRCNEFLPQESAALCNLKLTAPQLQRQWGTTLQLFYLIESLIKSMYIFPVKDFKMARERGRERESHVTPTSK